MPRLSGSGSSPSRICRSPLEVELDAQPKRGARVEHGQGTGFALSLDYAYKYLGILGPTNFFSFTLGW